MPEDGRLFVAIKNMVNRFSLYSIVYFVVAILGRQRQAQSFYSSFFCSSVALLHIRIAPLSTNCKLATVRINTNSVLHELEIACVQ